ncbi:arrestin [Stagonosporopsis vannaccii]|nr:arrestin [Stagonosporopsis vannaccii]
MDFKLDIENNKDVFSGGDHIVGKINIFCAQKTTISELTATLIGESTSYLTGAPGLLFSRREIERHVIVREENTIIAINDLPMPQKRRPLKLDVGCHSFNFRLRVPQAADCFTCPPNSPIEDHYRCGLVPERPKPHRRLPPSIKDVQNGHEITYRIDVVSTTIRNMFRSRTMKTCPITIWPIDTWLAQHDYDSTPFTTDITARATVLGPSSLPLPSCVLMEDILGLAPAEILITAMFQPDFQLVKIPRNNGRTLHSREVKMHLSVTKLNQHPQDLYLQSFQVLLVGYTDIRAGAATHGHMSFWTLQSLSNLGLHVFSASDPPGMQRDIDPKLWENITLDTSVVPDFVTCNLERRYELEVLMGWQCQSGEHAGRVFFVQVRTPVRIASGMRSAELIEKASFSVCESHSQSITSCKETRAHSDDEAQKAYARLGAPPTYDQAVREALDDGEVRFETKCVSR